MSELPPLGALPNEAMAAEFASEIDSVKTNVFTQNHGVINRMEFAAPTVMPYPRRPDTNGMAGESRLSPEVVDL